MADKLSLMRQASEKKKISKHEDYTIHPAYQ